MEYRWRATRINYIFLKILSLSSKGKLDENYVKSERDML